MAVFRFLLLVFNAAVVGFLIYRMLQVARQPMQQSKKLVIITGGVILLVAPFGMFFNFFMPTLQYFFIYPLVIVLFLYLTKQL